MNLVLPQAHPFNLRVRFFTTSFRKVIDQTLTPASPTAVVAVTPEDPTGALLANGFYYVVVSGGGQSWVLKLLVLR